jgi:hypothetical protein
MPAQTPERYLYQLKQNALNSFKAFGYESITVNGTVKNLTIPADAKYAVLEFESDAVGIAARCLQSGVTTVSSTVGIGLRDGTTMDITDMANLAGFQIIQAQAGTHRLFIEYYK